MAIYCGIRLAPPGCNPWMPFPEIPSPKPPDVISLPSTPTPDSRPSHYQTAIDPYKYALANNLGGLEMNVVKYVTRWKKKDGIKDLDKAIDTLLRLKAYAVSAECPV